MSDLRDALDEYQLWIKRTPLSPATRKAYVGAVTRFVAWADEHGEEYAEAMTNPDVREYAWSDYRRYLLQTLRRQPATVALIRSGIASFFSWGGAGALQGGRVDIPESEKRGLEDDDLRKVLRCARRHGPRDSAIVNVMFQAGLRVSDVSQLDVDDVAITERTGTLTIRYGKGGKPRTVTANSQVREALREWLDIRPNVVESDGRRPLFTGQGGERLRARGLERVAERISEETGVEFTPHTLRHTYGRRYMEAGGDVVTLATEMGHADLKTTRGYSKATAAQRTAAAEAVSIEW